jgi:secreted trypsin-like serine protease
VFGAGVSSASTGGKPGQYGVTDVYTRVSAYATWVEGVMSVAGG